MQLLRFTAPRRSFAAVLLLIAAALIFQMAAPDREWARLLTIGLQGAVVLASLSAAGANVRLMHAATLSIVSLLAVSLITLVGVGGIGPAVPRAVSLGLVVLAPAGIAVGLRRELREDRRVTLQTVYGGLCMYLLIGLAFGFAFNLTQDLSGGPFFDGGILGNSSEFLYFSLATLTTTGYGDFAAATDFGRTLAVSEALVGQIYMVTVVALLVSNLGRTASGEVADQVKSRVMGRASSGTEGDRSSSPDPG